MARVYRSICMELDEITVKIVELSEKFVTYKMEVEKIMNDGFVNIAKARYIMGSKCVSTLQLPTGNSNPIRPLATVCRAPKGDQWVFHACRREPSSKSSNELKEKSGNDRTKTSDFIRNIIDKDSTDIRKRKEFYIVEDGNYKSLNEELQDEISTTDSSKSAESQISFTDPIRLFGVLVPNTLRAAQKGFQDVINVLMHCATIQSETNVVLQRYHHLMKVKHLMESAGNERGIDLMEEKKYWTSSESSELSEEANLVGTVSQEGEFEIPAEGEESVKGEEYSFESDLEEKEQLLSQISSLADVRISENAEETGKEFSGESLEEFDASSQ